MTAMTTHDLTRSARRLAGMAAIALGLLAGCTTPPGGGGPGGGSPDLVAFGGMTFELPDGWEVISQNEDEGLESMCVGPAGNPYPQYDGCSGLTLHHGDRLPGHELDEYQDHGPWGWYHETDVSPCPDRAYAPGEPLNGIQQTEAGYAPVESGERPIGGRTAVYDRWDARCESGFTFSPRGWHVNDEQVLIFDVLGQPETEAVLYSVRWTG
jgi:hypothetical protein